MINGANTAIGPKSDQQALESLKARGGKPIEITITDLAKDFGWDGDKGRQRTLRRLRKWQDDKELKLGKGDDNLTIITVNKPVQPLSWWRRAVNTVRASVSFNLASFMALMFGLLAMVALFASAKLTSEYGETLGSKDASIETFKLISIVAELAAFSTPMGFDMLMDLGRRRLAFMSCGVVWVIATAWTLQAAFGYASINVADSAAVRSGTVERRADLEEDLRKLREARIERARKEARTNGQLAVKTGDLEAADRDIATLQGRIDALPKVASVDPQAENAYRIFGVPADKFANFRTIEITALPQLSGFLMAAAIGLWRGKRENEKPPKAGAKKRALRKKEA